ncbi:MAG TPA: hypothetical protein EYH08_04095 [Pyrodictium sp.]|nr:hypothetical protein [Pyrodictium sp.]
MGQLRTWYIRPRVESRTMVWLPYYEYKDRRVRVYCEASLFPRAEKPGNRILGVTTSPLLALASRGMPSQGIVVEPGLEPEKVVEEIVNACKYFEGGERVRWHILVGGEEGFKPLIRELFERIFVPPYKRHVKLKGYGVESSLARSLCHDLLKLLGRVRKTDVIVYRPFEIVFEGSEGGIHLVDLAGIGDGQDKLLSKLLCEEPGIKQYVLKLLETQLQMQQARSRAQ